MTMMMIYWVLTLTVTYHGKSFVGLFSPYSRSLLTLVLQRHRMSN